MMGTSSPDDLIVIQSNHWYTLWYVHTSHSDFTQYALTSHYIWITTFLPFIPISEKSSSTDTPTVVITDTNISGSHSLWMLPVTTYLLVPHKKFNYIIFPTGIVFMHPWSPLWTSPLACGTLIFLPALNILIRTLILMHFPHNFISKIIRPFCIVTSCHNPKSSFLAGYILQIGAAIVQLSTFVTHELC